MNINLNKWQSQIDDNENVFKITTPGTHDCTTKYVQLAHICRCQDKSISEQLEIGVRALDIRVAPEGDRLMLVHSIAKVLTGSSHHSEQMDLAHVLDECYAFLDENPSECIIFQFKNDNNKSMEKSFHNLFYTYIKGNEDRWFVENRTPLLKEARGKLVLVRRCSVDMQNPDFTPQNTGLDFSSWIEQDAVTPEPLKLGTGSSDDAVFIIQDRYKYKPNARWVKCLKPFLDTLGEFEGEYIINYTSTAGGTAGPKSNAKKINQKLMEYDFKKGVYYGVIYLDFAFEELTTKLIEQNFK